MQRRIARAMRAHPVVLAALAYAVVVLALLAPAVRPGRTLVPADTLTHYSPYRFQSGGFHAQNPAVADAATQFLPWMQFVDQSFHQNRVPEWNPEVLAGVPVTPNGYVAVYYPATWLARFFDAFDAYNLFVALHLVIGALGIFVLCRVLGARTLTAWFAGLMAPASGGWLHWSIHLDHLAAMVWLPWILVAVHRAVDRPGPGRAAVLAVVVGVWLSGANAQYAYMGGLVVAGYAIGLLFIRRSARALPALAAGALLGLLIAAPVILPTLATNRSILRQTEPSASMTQTHLPLRQGIRLLVPDATGNPVDGFVYAATQESWMNSPYFGLTALLMAVAALGSSSVRRNRPLMLLAIGAAGVLALSFTGAPHLVLRAILPGYNRFRGSARWVAVLPPLVLPVAARGFDSVMSRDLASRRVLMVGGCTAIGLVGLWLARETMIASAPHHYFDRRAALAAGLTVAILFAAAVAKWPHRAWRVAGPAVVVACVLTEVLFAVPRWYPSIVERTAYPAVDALAEAGTSGGRLVRVGGPRDLPDQIPPDIPLYYGVGDVSGVTPLFPKDYDRYLRLIDDYGDTARQLDVAPPLSDPAQLASPLLAALDARTALFLGALARPLSSPGAAVVVPRAERAGSDGGWGVLADPTHDINRVAEVVGLSDAVEGGSGTAVRMDDGANPDADRWSVDAPEGGLLRVSARYDKGWAARLDGARVRVFRSDGIFRAVVVPPGTHEVSFSYHNRAEDVGRRVAILALSVVVILAVAARRSHSGTRSAAPSQREL